MTNLHATGPRAIRCTTCRMVMRGAQLGDVKLCVSCAGQTDLLAVLSELVREDAAAAAVRVAVELYPDLAVVCPTCGEPAGRPCVTRSGRGTSTHAARRAL